MRRRVVFSSVLCALALWPASAAALRTPLPGIRSPSGNIKCLFVPGGPSMMLCSIGDADYATRLQARCMGPNGAGVDWHGFTLPATRAAQINCTGGILYNPGTQRPHYVTLPYGASWRHGSFTCSSRRSGVTCRNAAGHGVFLARESWRVW
jgi:hypothetical protein